MREATRGPLILASAPNGAYKQKSDHPAVPLTTAEIVDCAVQVQVLGASLFHLHIRDCKGTHSLDANQYLATIEAIKKQVGDKLIIQITSEAGGRYRPIEQCDTIRAVQPESVSIAIRELIPTPADEPAAADFFDWLASSPTAPQFILYDVADLKRFQSLLVRQLIPELPMSVLFVLGRYQQHASRPADLLPFLDQFKAVSCTTNLPWMVCAFGPTELDCALAAAEHGGHCRVGFENNLFLADGSRAENNAALIRQAQAQFHDRAYALATAKQARRLLNPTATQPAV